MFKFLNKGISTPLAIIIIIVLAVVLFGGIYAYQYYYTVPGESRLIEEPEAPKTIIENEKGTESGCTDSDGGNKIYEKGKACFKGECKEDYCRAEGEDFPLKEYFCYPDGIGGGVYPCLNGCLDGACIQGEEGVPGCVDSDGGKDYYKKGTITVKGTSIGEITAEDLCRGDELLEFFCRPEFDMPDETRYNCPNSCSDGACN